MADNSQTAHEPCGCKCAWVGEKYHATVCIRHMQELLNDFSEYEDNRLRIEEENAR